MNNPDPRSTSMYTRIIGFPYYLEETSSDSEEFRVITAHTRTDDDTSRVKRGLLLFLDSDIEEVEDPGQFRVRLEHDKYPGCLIDALRGYAELRDKKYVALNSDQSRESLQFRDKEIVVIKPRLFVRLNEPIDEPYSPFQQGSGVGPQLVLA